MCTPALFCFARLVKFAVAGQSHDGYHVDDSNEMFEELIRCLESFVLHGRFVDGWSV